MGPTSVQAQLCVYLPVVLNPPTLQPMSNFVPYGHVRYAKIPFIVGDQPDSKRWISGWSLSKQKLFENASMKAVDLDQGCQ